MIRILSLLVFVGLTKASSPSSSSIVPPVPTATAMGHEDEWILEEEYPGGSKQTPRRSAVDDEDEGSYWVECVRNTADVYDDDEEDAFDVRPQRAPRMTHNRVDDTAKNNDSPSQLSDEHPMRTDEWLVEVHPRRRPHRSWFPCSSTNTVSRGVVAQRFQFAPNGHVLLIEVPNNKQRRTRVGEWYMDYTGIKWDIPIWLEDTNNNTPRQRRSPSSTKTKKSRASPAGDMASQQEELWEENVVAAALEAVTGDLSESTKTKSNSNNNINRRTGMLHYHADIHLNKFGKQPRMFRGVVTRDRCSDKPHLFRPVLATFTAQGIGKDTVNVSYENRGFGLSKPQVDKK
eukprot:CAMPEP_0198284320 /NCGR_PEP_ID=MMETSP1449-20131203/3794_1 /TAXON_ID=420275 /ORGANISM="Attheya septentrionalis, Strain CCMP2084" /LENGTH=344 /DNA_ID=CAMNT_0043981329 /DNA_START=80 /DNA_END=1114 /DNA_ORIENTATION=-